MNRQGRRLAAVGVAALSLGACTARRHRIDASRCPVVTTKAADAVDVRYLGVGGVLLAHGSDAILTAPLYSNPSLVEFALDHQIRPDPMVIDRLFPVEGTAAQAILVGHSHYDHLMDVPYVALHHAKNAKVYGSQTTANLLHSMGARVVSLDGMALDPGLGQPGQWVNVTSTMRVMAIRSEHSDQFELKLVGMGMPFHLFRGEQETPLPQPPTQASGWPEGRVFAYLIDFLDGAGQPVFRAYFQDSGANRDIGLPTPAQLEAWGRRTVDLALICVGGEWGRLRGHPEHLIRALNPRFAVLIHWEDFFVTQQAACVDEAFLSPPTVPTFLGFLGSTDVDRFRTRIKETDPALFKRTWVPCPTASTFRLPVGNDAVQESKTAFDCRPFERTPAR
jgi:L-ascorbate metabolism protein UlaG (beta-lactamase superfamily)